MIVITGSGFCGTSVIAGLLKEIGGDFGETAQLDMTGTISQSGLLLNTGYLENVEVYALNAVMSLNEWVKPRHFGTASYQRSFYQLFRIALAKTRQFSRPDRDKIAAIAEKYKEEMAALSRKYEQVIVKDPKFSFTVPEWKKYGTIEKVLCSYRHPRAVADSLRRKYLVPMSLGFKVWQYRVESFLEWAHTVPLVVIRFANFFQKDLRMREMKRLYNFLDVEFSERQAEEIMDRLIDGSRMGRAYSDEDVPSDLLPLMDRLDQYHDRYAEIKSGALGH